MPCCRTGAEVRITTAVVMVAMMACGKSAGEIRSVVPDASTSVKQVLAEAMDNRLTPDVFAKKYGGKVMEVQGHLWRPPALGDDGRVSLLLGETRVVTRLSSARSSRTRRRLRSTWECAAQFAFVVC